MSNDKGYKHLHYVDAVSIIVLLLFYFFISNIQIPAEATVHEALHLTAMFLEEPKSQIFSIYTVNWL